MNTTVYTDEETPFALRMNDVAKELTIWDEKGNWVTSLWVLLDGLAIDTTITKNGKNPNRIIQILMKKGEP